MHLLYTLALLCGGLFAGTCLYVAVVAQPARRQLSDAVALQIFKASLRYSERMQPALAALSLVGTLGVCLLEPTAVRLAALAVVAPIIPASIYFAVPIYRAIRAPELEADPARAAPLLQRFARVHELRTAVACLGFVLQVLGVWGG